MSFLQRLSQVPYSFPRSCYCSLRGTVPFPTIQGEIVRCRSTHSLSATYNMNSQRGYIYIQPISCHSVQPRRFAKGKASTTKKKDEPPATSSPIAPLDPTVCNGVNVLKNGSDPPIKPDSEYPDWLWGLIEGGQPPMSPSQLSPETKQYWRRFNKERAHKKNMLQQQLGRN